MFDNDHRRIGRRLRLFHFQEQAPGMVFWHPRGWALYRALERAVRRRMLADGYCEVRSPELLRRPIWESSGHWQHFSESMFRLEDENAPAALKPVSCPGHIQIVERMRPSHADLPLRIGELGLVHRAEQSGCLHGLLRLRQFCQDDGHVFCREDQVEAELDRFLESLISFYRVFGISELRVAFSSRPAVRAGDDAIWDRAEHLLRDAAKARGIACEEQPGQGAFYGPKLEVLLQDARGQAWQCGTLQLDFLLADRFGLAYVDSANARRAPVILHRALLGSFERFIGLLLERHGASIPDWLAPEQVLVAPISAAERAYAQRVVDELSARGVRAALDLREERLGRRVRDAHARAVPVFAIAGPREAAEGSLALRERNGRSVQRPLAEALEVLALRFRPAA